MSRPSEKTTKSSTRRKKAAARLSVGCTALLVVLKLVVGLKTGSVGILSEAAHSGTDMVAACIAYMAVRVSDKPPDELHPYGHGKVESISGLLEAQLIFLAVILICWEAIYKLIAPPPTPPDALIGLAVMAVSAVSNVLVARYLLHVAHQTDSLALEADAHHLQTDFYTSVGVAVGLILVHFTHQSWFDPIAALSVAMLILSTGIRLTRDALSPLLDTCLPAEEVKTIREIIESHPGVLSYHQLRTRKSGSQRHADLHLQIEDQTPLVEAHALSEAVEDRIRAAFPNIQVHIHIEPYHEELRHQANEHQKHYGK